MMKEKLKKIIFLILCVVVYLLAVHLNGGHFVFFVSAPQPDRSVFYTPEPFDR